jgi:hypothetical protein
MSLLLVVACGDDDGDGALGGDTGGGGELSAEEQEQADRVAAALLADEDDYGEVTQEEADCVGRAAVQGLGVERTTELDWEADDPAFVPDDAPVVADAIVSCIDIAPVFASSFAADGELTSEQGECVANDLSDDELRDILEFTIANPDSSPTAEIAGPLADTLVECMDFGALIVEQFTAGGISEESAQCVADAVPQDVIRDMALAGMIDEDSSEVEAEFEQAMQDAADECLTPEERELIEG